MKQEVEQEVKQEVEAVVELQSSKFDPIADVCLNDPSGHIRGAQIT